MAKELRIIDVSTGEDVTTGYQMKSVASISAYQARMNRGTTDQRHYVNCYHDPISELNEKLAVNELGAIMKLLPYLRMNSGGKLIHAGKPMGAAEIGNAIDKGARWTASLLRKLVDEDVLIPEQAGRKLVYRVNERYHTIGHTLKDSYYTKLYQVKTRTDIKNISIQAAGVLYKMLPFFHYTRYYLVTNPNEPDDSKLDHLTQNGLASFVNVERGVINRAIAELNRAGFVMESKSFGATIIRVNPDVMFRQRVGDEFTEEVRYDFEQHRKAAEKNGSNTA